MRRSTSSTPTGGLILRVLVRIDLELPENSTVSLRKRMQQRLPKLASVEVIVTVPEPEAVRHPVATRHTPT